MARAPRRPRTRRVSRTIGTGRGSAHDRSRRGYLDQSVKPTQREGQQMATTPTIDEVRDEVTRFLDANAARKPPQKAFRWGEGSDDVAMFEEVDPEVERQALAKAKAWRAKRFDAGLGYITGPAEYGGRELPPAYARVYDGLEARYEVPSQSFCDLGVAMVGPPVKDHAQPHIEARYRPALHRGDIVGGQLYSEPGAGSDQAGLQTRAERDGDEWVISGQKV